MDYEFFRRSSKHNFEVRRRFVDIPASVPYEPCPLSRDFFAVIDRGIELDFLQNLEIRASVATRAADPRFIDDILPPQVEERDYRVAHALEHLVVVDLFEKGVIQLGDEGMQIGTTRLSKEPSFAGFWIRDDVIPREAIHRSVLKVLKFLD